MNSFVRFFLFVLILFSKGNFSIDQFLANIKLNSFDFVTEFVKKIEYSNVVGRLVIDSLDIDNILVQSSDNLYYLEHDIYGNVDSEGAVFLDYRNSIDLDRKLLIYGHNSKDSETIFNRLENYLSFDFFSSNKEIKLITMNKEMIYEISNILIMTEDSFGHMKLIFDDDSWRNYVNFINNNSLYGDGLNYLDDVLVLQTCNYNPDNTFLLVIAKKKKEILF